MTRALAILLVLAACDKDPVSVEPSNNDHILVENLFTYDGCTVYRFHDAGRNVYFAKCGGQAAPTSETHSQYCGKGCLREVATQTLALKP